MTDYKTMFEQAVRTLAAIDDALGIGDDGCGDPEQTLTAIADLKDAALRGESLARAVMADQTAHDKKYSEWPGAWELWISRPDRNQGWVRYNVYETHAQAKAALRRVEGPPLELKIVGLYAKQA